jgi:hypothetical protein
VVEHVLAKHEIGVRFPLPAPKSDPFYFFEVGRVFLWNYRRLMSNTGRFFFGGIIILSTFFFNQHFIASGDNSLNIAYEESCTQDSQCAGGSMCIYGTCQSAFACEPFVDARWDKPEDLLANGAFDEAKNPEYMELVPLPQPNSCSSARYALRVQGGPTGEHSTERALIKYFTPTKEVWAGSMMVNLSKLLDAPEQYPSAVILAGGYTDSRWPQSVQGAWWRDLMLGAVNNKTLRMRTLGASAYYHNAGAPWPIQALTPSEAIPYSELGWLDRFILVEWYFTPTHNLFVRVDKQTWVKIGEVHPNPPASNQQFRGFAAGWISSYMGGSVDFKEIKLYDSNCLIPSPKPSEF